MTDAAEEILDRFADIVETMVLHRMSQTDDAMFRLIDATPHLDWLLLTKRPGNIQRMWSDCAVEGNRQPHSDGRNNVWLGTSISDQETCSRLERGE